MHPCRLLLIKARQWAIGRGPLCRAEGFVCCVLSRQQKNVLGHHIKCALPRLPTAPATDLSAGKPACTRPGASRPPRLSLHEPRGPACTRHRRSTMGGSRGSRTARAAALSALLLLAAAAAVQALRPLPAEGEAALQRGRGDREEELNLRPLIGVVSQVRRDPRSHACIAPTAAALPLLLGAARTAAQPPTTSRPSPCRPPAHPSPWPQLGDPAPKGHSYIAASYVKLVESAGARAVPITCDMPPEEVERRFKVGVLWVCRLLPCTARRLTKSVQHAGAGRSVNSTLDHLTLHRCLPRPHLRRR